MDKYIFFDIDNTIYTPKLDKIRKSVIKLFQKIKEKNEYKIGIATGRSNSSIGCIQRLLPYVDYLVLSNGMLVKDINNNIIYEKTFKEKEIIEILEKAKDNNLLMGVGGENVLGILSKPRQEVFSRGEPEITLMTIAGKKIHSIWLTGEDQSLDNFYNELNKKYEIFYWNKYGVDLSFKKHNKKEGVFKIINEDDFLISVGDGENDLELAKFANIKIAFKSSACSELKAIADHLASKSDSDDLYHIFKGLKII